MLIKRGYRTELDLNNQQITLCKKHAGAARYAYNWGLSRKQEVYQQTGRSISAMELHRELNQLKQTELPWMYEVSKAAPQEALRDLDDAFRRFFRRVQLKTEGKWKGKLGYPKFKTKRKGLGSFRLTGSIHIYECAVDLPRLGSLRLHERGYLPTSGVQVLSAIVCEEAGRWFVSVQVEEEVPDPPPGTGEPIGVDLGIKTLAQCSDGMTIENPKALRSELKRIRRLHRRLSRKAKGSKNRTKARQRLARKYARVAHIRRDALHQGTSRLTRARLSPEERTARSLEIASTLPEPKAKVKPRKGRPSQATEAPPLPENVAKQVKQKQVKRLLRQATTADAALRPRVVVLEDLNVEGMKRNRKIALSISDVGLGEFRRQMHYKTAWKGERFLLADRYFPSTKMCSGCGHVKEEMDLSERVYVCEHCGLVMDRDLNAALNLAALAHEVLKLAKQNPDRSLEALFHEVMAKTMQADQPSPYREFLGKGETPVERGALAGPGKASETPLSEAGTGYQIWPVHMWRDSGERPFLIPPASESP
jgi:transposase